MADRKVSCLKSVLSQVRQRGSRALRVLLVVYWTVGLSLQSLGAAEQAEGRSLYLVEDISPCQFTSNIEMENLHIRHVVAGVNAERVPFSPGQLYTSLKPRSDTENGLLGYHILVAVLESAPGSTRQHSRLSSDLQSGLGRNVECGGLALVHKVQFDANSNSIYPTAPDTGNVGSYLGLTHFTGIGIRFSGMGIGLERSFDGSLAHFSSPLHFMQVCTNEPDTDCRAEEPQGSNYHSPIGPIGYIDLRLQLVLGALALVGGFYNLTYAFRKQPGISERAAMFNIVSGCLGIMIGMYICIFAAAAM